VSKVVTFLAMRRAAHAFGNWRHANTTAMELRKSLGSMTRVLIHLIGRRHLARAWLSWIAYWSLSRRKTRLFLQGVGYLLSRQLHRCWRTWYAYALDMRAYLEVVSMQVRSPLPALN
jgi:hypothetical protein